MGTIRLVLRSDKPDKNGLSPLQLIYQLSGERKYFNTGIDLLEENWDDKAKKAVYVRLNDLKRFFKPKDEGQEKLKAYYLKNPGVKVPVSAIYENLKSAAEIEEINLKISSLRKEIKDAENRFALNGIIYSVDMIIQSLKDARSPTTKKEASSKELFSFIDKYISDHSATRKAGSLSVYKALKTHLKAFIEHAKVDITFENIDYSFFQEFQNFLIDKRGLNNTTVAKQLSTIKTFINYARMHGVPVNDKYKHFKIKKENLEVIALTNQEFETLYNMDLSDNKKMAQVRDVFCFACATGLRYSDLKQLDWIHINRDEIRLVVTKTSEALAIPLNPYSAAILEKYKGQLKPLPVISNQKMNEYLNGKDEKTAEGSIKHYPGLCELAGIDEPIEIVRFRGAKRETKTYPKYELISVHTGRKTFATLSLEKGMSAEEVMTITGHKDYKSFKRYVNITETRKKAVMARAWGVIKDNNLKAI